MKDDEVLLDLIDCTMKFHIGVESGQAAMLSIQCVFATKYDFDFMAQNLVNHLKEDLVVVPAMIMLTHRINTCILHT